MEREQRNLRIRNALKEYGVKQWQLAELLGCGEYTLCRKLRHELPDEEQKRIVALIMEQSE